MREINSHQTNICNKSLKIYACDEPGIGNSCHRYEISGFDPDTNPSALGARPFQSKASILFQNGPIKEVGTNGVTHEALLAILIDRLQHFQAGSYSCRENAIALTKLEEALMWLKKRTEDRVNRGVEGTHEQ